MKRYLAIPLLLCTILAGYAQPAHPLDITDIQFEKHFANGKIPRVTGKLLNAGPEDLKQITISYTQVTLAGQVRKTANVSADGTFTLELDYPLPYQQVWLTAKKLFYAGIYANTDLHIELDIAKLKASGKELLWNGDGVRYLGTDGPLNVYMNNYVMFRRKEQLALGERVMQIERLPDPSIMLPVYNRIDDSLKMIEDDYIAKNPSPYAWLIRNERLSEYYCNMVTHYWGHTMTDSLLQKIKAHNLYLVTNNSTILYYYLATYFQILHGKSVSVSWKDVAMLEDLDEVEKAAVDSLRMAASRDTMPPFATENKQKWTQQLQKRLAFVRRKRVLDRTVHALDSIFPPAKADLVKLNLNDSKDIKQQRADLERLLPSMRTGWCRTITKKNYEETVAKIEAVNKALAGGTNSLTASGFGKPMLQTDFGASLYKISNTSADDFLAVLKKSFNGKALLIDLWATWCAPCLGEMPRSKALHQDAKDLPVQFVYLCTENGSDEEIWKRKIAELQLPGVHFFIDQKLDAELAQYFSFTGYPGHALIDRNGVYKPGAYRWLSDIKDKDALAEMIK